MKYLKTSDELLFESLLSESIVYYSPELRQALNRLKSKNPIAQDLIDVEGQDIDSDLTFLDFGTEGYLTFQQMPKAMKLIKAEWSSKPTDSPWPDESGVGVDLDVQFDRRTSDILYNNDVNNYRFTGVWKGNRNQIKIGKVVNKSLSGKYTESEIENFVNLLKATQTYRGELKLVEGEEINHWYKSENYESSNGSLGNSCMKDSNDLKIYVRNPDVCKMLILVRDGKLAARALVWKLYSSTIPGRPEWFMDRVYVCKDADYQLLRGEAAKRGWAFRTTNSNSGYIEATYKSKEYEDVEMKVKVRPGDYKTYPYLDTFKRYVPRTGMLYNDERYSAADGIILTSTIGSFRSVRRDQGLFRRMASNLRDRVSPIPVIEAKDTWLRAEDRNWVVLKRSGVPDIPSGDEASDYYKRYEPIEITQEDLNSLKSIVDQFNKSESTFQFNCVTDSGYSLKKTAVSTNLNLISPINWSCKFWFCKRTFLSEDWWILSPYKAENIMFDWNSETKIHMTDHILCDGLRGVEDFLKSYTG